MTFSKLFQSLWKKDDELKIPMEEDLKDKIKALSDASGLGVNDWLKRAVRRAVDQESLPPDKMAAAKVMDEAFAKMDKIDDSATISNNVFPVPPSLKVPEWTPPASMGGPAETPVAAPVQSAPVDTRAPAVTEQLQIHSCIHYRKGHPRDPQAGQCAKSGDGWNGRVCFWNSMVAKQCTGFRGKDQMQR